LAKHKEYINQNGIDEDLGLDINIDIEASVERLRVVGEFTDTPNKKQASPKGMSSMDVVGPTLKTKQFSLDVS